MFCKECGKDISHKKDKRTKFCDRSCSTMFNNRLRTPRTEESKKKTAESVKKTNASKPIETPFERAIRLNSKCKLVWKECSVCNKTMIQKSGIYVDHCSDECRNQARSISSINQLKKGNGKKGYYKGVWCDSTYELAFLVYHIEKGIEIERYSEMFEYEYEGKTHKYNPDFIVDGEIYEIKGYFNERAKIKHEAANKIKPIKLLLKKDLNKYFEFIENEFGVDKEMLHSLYDDSTIKEKICKNCKQPYLNKNKTFCSIKCSGEYQFRVNMVEDEKGRFIKNG